MFPQECFTFRGIDVPSGVSDQPQNDVETLQGAKQRAANAQEQVPEADFLGRDRRRRGWLTW
jgi:non-canonical (house-cleaning) NTP pyrophosphatase